MVHKKKQFRSRMRELFDKGWSTDLYFGMTKIQANARVSYLKDHGITAMAVKKGETWATLRKEKK